MPKTKTHFSAVEKDLEKVISMLESIAKKLKHTSPVSSAHGTSKIHAKTTKAVTKVVKTMGNTMKKGRGRPPKNAISSAIDTQVKRGRGRPRKAA